MTTADAARRWAEAWKSGWESLAFDDDGFVVEQWDAWNQAPRRVEPRDDIGPFGRS